MPALAASLVALLPYASAGGGATRGAQVSAAAGSVGAPLDAAVLDAVAASHCARAAALLGSNCSYSTGMMARRVLEEGQDWSFEGGLLPSENSLGSMVAAPFLVSDGFNVIANELLELVSQGGHLQSRLALAGKLLEVDGVRYVVLTSFRVMNA